MKPSVGSLAIAFGLLGVAFIGRGLFGIPSPTLLAFGAGSGAIAVALTLRSRTGLRAGALATFGSFGLSAFRLYRAVMTPGHDGVVAAAIGVAVAAYLLFGLFSVRAKFVE